MGHDGVVGAGGEAAILVLHHRHRVHVAPADHRLGVRLRDTWFDRLGNFLSVELNRYLNDLSIKN